MLPISNFYCYFCFRQCIALVWPQPSTSTKKCCDLHEVKNYKQVFVSMWPIVSRGNQIEDCTIQVHELKSTLQYWRWYCQGFLLCRRKSTEMLCVFPSVWDDNIAWQWNRIESIFWLKQRKQKLLEQDLNLGPQEYPLNKNRFTCTMVMMVLLQTLPKYKGNFFFLVFPKLV